MTISLHKNLKIENTGDSFVYHLEDMYYSIYAYFIKYYSQDLEQEITYYDLLASLSSQYKVNYINLPEKANFIWKINGKVSTLKEIDCFYKQKIEYLLSYEDGSMYEGSLVVEDNYTLDLNDISSNKFLVKVSSDKPISTLVIIRHIGTEKQEKFVITEPKYNIYTFYAEENEKIEIIPYSLNWSYNDRSTGSYGHP